ncbi:MAG: hypothetical protein AAB495_04315 [Patescibacteria group bacterium]
MLDQHTWRGDSWDPMNYGREYDFSRPFFEQISELMHEVPFPSLNNWDAVNSDYCNFTKGNKNCYLVFGGDFNEDAEYSGYNFHTKNSSDLYWVNKGEFCYELIDAESNYQCTNARYIESCVDVRFGFELKACQNCIGCINLRNTKQCFFNEQLSPEEYAKRVAEIDFGSYKAIEELEARFEELKARSIFRAYRMINSVNSSGDNLYNCKNCTYCFDIFDGAEDCRHIFLAASGLKDSYGSGHCGLKSELLYNSLSVYPSSNIIASWIVINCHNAKHSINCQDSGNIFGCVGIKNKQYCVLNKQYSKEEYEALVPKIMEHMESAPYRDKKNRTYVYGDFFPAELSPFGYNETFAYELMPLGRKEALALGFAWFDRPERHYEITLKNADIPDNIKDVQDDILNEVVECADMGNCEEGCTVAFKIIKPELDIYRHMRIPLPRLCPNCRSARRIRQRNPSLLWERSCQCAGKESENKKYLNNSTHFHGAEHCANTFQTTYAPGKPEIVYCEQCYQAEVS